MAGDGFWAPLPSLGGSSDVDTTTNPPTDGQALVYDDTTGQWVPGDVAATEVDIRDAGRWEVVVAGNPAEAVHTPDGTDWLYAWVSG